MNKPLKIRSRALLAGVALIATSVACSGTAMAETINLGTVGSGQSTSTGPIVHSRGSFMDTVTFNLTSKGLGQVGNNVLFFQLNNIVFQNIGNLSLNLMGPSGFGTVAISNFMSGVNYDMHFVPGTYTALLGGNATGRAGGTYTFGVAAPVPEPEAWLSMILGMAAAGWLARRKKVNIKFGFKPSLAAA